jgi:phosphoribosyl-AMP cyclohydrolase
MKQEINFTKGNGLVPAIVQDYVTGRVYMLGYMNKLALEQTLESGFVHFWSRSRNSLWLKGEESGNKLKVEELYKDCDDDTVLIKVTLDGNAVCHTGNLSCFFTEIS